MCAPTCVLGSGWRGPASEFIPGLGILCESLRLSDQPGCPPHLSWLGLAPIPQNLPGAERLSPKNRAWAPQRLFFSLPRDLPSSAQGAWDSKSHPGSPETVGMGAWRISVYLGSVKGQGLELRPEVWSGLTRAPGSWFNLGLGKRVHSLGAGAGTSPG